MHGSEISGVDSPCSIRWTCMQMTIVFFVCTLVFRIRVRSHRMPLDEPQISRSDMLRGGGEPCTSDTPTTHRDEERIAKWASQQYYDRPGKYGVYDSTQDPHRGPLLQKPKSEVSVRTICMGCRVTSVISGRTLTEEEMR